jgi:stage V sporulation protein B
LKANAGKQSFLSGAAILALAVAVTKIIGALYKIPLGNLLDREGMAHFYVAYNIYNLLLTLSTAGLPLAISRLVSEATALGRENQKRRILQVSLVLFALMGVVLSAAMFWGNGLLAGLLNDSLAALSIRVLSPAVLCVCLMSAVRGFTQGEGNMLPTAGSEVVEAVGKLLVGLTLAWLLLRQGLGAPVGAAGAIAGVSAGAALGTLALLILLLRRRRIPGSDVPESRRAILKRILAIGIPITVGAGGMSLITLLDQSIVMGTLQQSLGLSEQAAASLYGEYTFGMTLFAMPPAFIYPIAISLVPSISGALARGDTKTAQHSAATACRAASLLALPAGVGLSVLAGPILRLLYPAVPETAAAATYHLQVLGIACIFVCLMVLTNGILQAYGKEYIPIFTLLSGGILKIVVNYFMVGNPSIGIKGASVGTLYCYVLIVILNLIAIRRVVPQQIDFGSLFGRPLLATAVMGGCAWGGHLLLCRILPSSVATVLAVLLAVVVYGALVLALHIVSREEIELLPGGKKIAKFLHLS